MAKRAVKYVEKVAKASLKKAKKKKAKNSRALYTEKEKKELASLRNKRSYYKSKMKELAGSSIDGLAITLKDIRNNLSEDTARELAYQGYFDSDKSDDYYNKDFRQWMTENGDDELLTATIEEYNSLAIDDTKIGDIDADVLAKNKKLTEYADKVKSIDEDINKIKDKALDRKNMKIARELARKNNIENAESLIDALDKGDIALSKLSNPERAAVEAIKKKFAKEVVKEATSDMDPEKQPIAKRAIYSGIMDNPMEGVRVAIKETVVAEVVQKYGNAAGPVADSLVDLATGKGSIKGLGMGIFQGIVSNSGLNEDLMNERAEELIESGESDSDTENMKMLGRDVVLDIAASVIKSGGNIYAAIPIAIKDILFDVGKAGLRKIKQKE